MSISASTLAVLLFLLPGFLFLVGCFNAARTKPSIRLSALSTLLVIFSISLAVNSISFPIYTNLLSKIGLFLEINENGFFIIDKTKNTCAIPLKCIPKKNIDSFDFFLFNYYWYVFFYVFFSLLASYFLGIMYMYLVVTRFAFFGTDLYHGPLYKFVAGKKRPYPVVSILTNICVGSYYVGYEGYATHFELKENNKIDYVALELAKKFTFKVTEDGLLKTEKSITDVELPGYYSKINADDTDHVLVIDGEEIMNISLTHSQKRGNKFFELRMIFQKLSRQTSEQKKS